jgi:hypothetical protein
MPSLLLRVQSVREHRHSSGFWHQKLHSFMYAVACKPFEVLLHYTEGIISRRAYTFFRLLISEIEPFPFLFLYIKSSLFPIFLNLYLSMKSLSR